MYVKMDFLNSSFKMEQEFAGLAQDNAEHAHKALQNALHVTQQSTEFKDMILWDERLACAELDITH